MTINQKYHKNYTEFAEPYQLVLPLNLEGLVPDDDSVRLLATNWRDWITACCIRLTLPKAEIRQ